MNPYAFARFTTVGLPGGTVEITCTRCGAFRVLRPGDLPGGAVTLSDQLVWAKDHRCPQVSVPSRARELVAV